MLLGVGIATLHQTHPDPWGVLLQLLALLCESMRLAMINKVLVTKGIKLVGGDGYHELLYVQIVQKYGVSEAIARHLTHTYGAAAFAVCEQKPSGNKKGNPVLKTLVDGCAPAGGD